VELYIAKITDSKGAEKVPVVEVSNPYWCQGYLADNRRRLTTQGQSGRLT
jgi:hypothetical protein